MFHFGARANLLPIPVAAYSSLLELACLALSRQCIEDGVFLLRMRFIFLFGLTYVCAEFLPQHALKLVYVPCTFR